MYATAVEDRYEYTNESLDRLAAAGIMPLDADFVLRHSTPRVRQHIGSVLRIIGRDPQGVWIVVACIEITDDTYTIVGGRLLDDAEVRAVIDLMGEQL